MPSLVGYCWKRSENNDLEINWGSQTPATEDVLKMLACLSYGACRRNHFHCLSNSLFCTDACHLFDRDNQSTIDYVNNNTCDECHYENVSKNADEWKRLYVKAFNTTYLYFIFIFCTLYSIQSVCSLIWLFKQCHVNTYIL